MIQRTGICKYCGTVFVIEKINYFETSAHKLFSYKGEEEIVKILTYITVVGEISFKEKVILKR